MSASATPPDLLTILRDGTPRTKSELAEITGRARSTVSARLAELLERGLIVQLERTVSTKGRPSALYSLETERRVIGAVDLGSRHGVFALTDLVGEILVHHPLPLDIAEGPEKVLELAVDSLGGMLSDLGRPPSDLVALGVGLPGPVEFESGTPVSPPIMPGWDHYDVRTHLRRTFDVPVVVDNDVNVMAVGEHLSAHADEDNLLMVKIATGISAGVIASGHLVRGADGSAGDIGHIQIPGEQTRVCRCGQLGCCESIASGPSVALTLSEMGVEASSTEDVVRLVRSGDLVATRVVRDAGRTLGRVLATCVCVLNPGLIVIGGDLALVGEPLLAGIREVIYQQSQPLATKHLRIQTASNNAFAGVIGVSRLAQDMVFDQA
jgi:predicted NBD/HSP70 family sugar kinase